LTFSMPDAFRGFRQQLGGIGRLAIGHHKDPGAVAVEVGRLVVSLTLFDQFVGPENGRGHRGSPSAAKTGGLNSAGKVKSCATWTLPPKVTTAISTRWATCGFLSNSLWSA